MNDKEQWIKIIQENSAEAIANIIIADIERIKELKKEIEELKKEYIS